MSARSDSRTTERRLAPTEFGFHAHENIPVGHLSPDSGRALEPGAGLDAPPSGRVRRDLGRARARPGRRPRAGGRAGARGECRSEGVPAAFESTATLLGESAAGSSDPRRLQAWWLYRMLFSPDPLLERLTLMWHDHFATSQLKVEDTAAMRAQNETFRRLARGPFGDLLRAMLRDPALLAWLDAPTNRKGKPNENLARELLELFTLGVGRYEDDVKETARALTGRTVARGRFQAPGRQTTARRPSSARRPVSRATPWRTTCSHSRRRPTAWPGGCARRSSARAWPTIRPGARWPTSSAATA